MPPMPSQIDTYQDMSALSAQMVEAASANDWNRLVALERAVVALRDTLTAAEDNAGLSEQELAVKAALIRRILDDDAEVRRHTEPWMEKLRHLFSGNRGSRLA
jgi:flagellar protein FliT